MKRRILLLGVDLFWVALSPFMALFIRENFAPRAETLEAAYGYAITGVIAGVVVLPLVGLNRGLWRYASLPDLMRLMFAVTAIVMLSLFATFAFSRLEDVARSIPVIQWFILLALMGGSRVAIRVWQEGRRPVPRDFLEFGDNQNVLIVGVNQIAELYLRSIKEFAPRTISVVGILAKGAELPGRQLRSHQVLGQPEDLAEVLKRLEVHGATPTRIVVAEPISQLSRAALNALLEVERSSTIRVDWMPELLGFAPRGGREEAPTVALHETPQDSEPVLFDPAPASVGRYHQVKRVIDMVGAAVLILALAPLIAVVAVLTMLDVGLPVVFWQRRPGRQGYVFKLYKFRTMRGAHDQEGNRIPDRLRSSRFGDLLRRSRLDELPQLYNVLIGEMSFIGPRPLLPVDHGPGTEWRLLVRPGLTGWAQVKGGRQLSAEDKAALDVWYVQNMSFGLDVRIAVSTLVLFSRGERVDQNAIASARESIPSAMGHGAKGFAKPSGSTTGPCKRGGVAPTGLAT